MKTCDYRPIPIYGNLEWDLVSEGINILLLAPTGAGKTIFLSYLAGMALKRGHRLFVIDAKNSSFGQSFKNCGVPVATNADEILKLLRALESDMRKDYEKYFATAQVGLDANFSTLKNPLPAKVLLFDEVLAALETGDKKQKIEMESLLKRLVLQGRAAGYSVVLASQRLLAGDLPKAITDQCGTKFLLGSNVGEELFHLATGLYKKDLGTPYKGGQGKGYCITPKNGLSYFETPFLDTSRLDLIALFHSFRQRSVDYGGDF